MATVFMNVENILYLLFATRENIWYPIKNTKIYIHESIHPLHLTVSHHLMDHELRTRESHSHQAGMDTLYERMRR